MNIPCFHIEAGGAGKEHASASQTPQSEGVQERAVRNQSPALGTLSMDTKEVIDRQQNLQVGTCTLEWICLSALAWLLPHFDCISSSSATQVLCSGAEDVQCATMQDDLTDDMVELAAGLKRNAQAMQQSVAQRGTLLEETDESIERNLAAAQKSVKRAKEEHTRSILISEH